MRYLLILLIVLPVAAAKPLTGQTNPHPSWGYYEGVVEAERELLDTDEIDQAQAEIRNTILKGNLPNEDLTLLPPPEPLPIGGGNEVTCFLSDDHSTAICIGRTYRLDPSVNQIERFVDDPFNDPAAAPSTKSKGKAQ